MIKRETELNAQLSACLYRLAGMERMAGTDRAPRQNGGAHKLLLIRSGGGWLHIGGRRHALGGAKAFIVPPRAAYRIDADPAGPFACAGIAFHALQPRGDGLYGPASLGLPAELRVAYPQAADDRVREIETRLAGDKWDRMNADIIFQDLLLLLFKTWSGEGGSAQQTAVMAAAEYMDRNYRHSITRERLAEMAGMSADYFTRMFKKATGRTPSDYLTDVRINHAKQALVLSDDSYRSIAQSVGFSDEFYFSRRFKLATGMSPSAFAGKMRAAHRLASLHHQLTGHLIALGAPPYAALHSGYYPLEEKLAGTVGIGVERPDLDKLVAASPDLIFTCEFYDEETSPKARMFDRIAPTVTVPFFDDWRTQLVMIARAIGREKEAARWLERYDEAASAVRSDVQAAAGGESVLIVGVGNDRLCLFGRRNVGAVLYGDLGLGVPDRAADIDFYREMTADDIVACDADRILLTAFRNDGSAAARHGADKALRRLRAVPGWREHRAVRRGRVHSLLEKQHLYTLYTSYSHRLLLDKLRRLLTTDLSK